MTYLESGQLPVVGTKHSQLIEITENSIQMYVALCGDDAPVHVDSEFARSKGFESPICHGMLLGSFVSTALGTRLPGKHSVLKTINLNFRNAVTYPCTVQLHVQVAKVFESVGMVRLAIEILSEAGVTLANGSAECIVQ